MTVVTVYTRRGCHLCEEAERIAADVARGRAEVRLVDIDEDVGLRDRYTVRVPVVEVDGIEVAQFVLDAATLSAALDGVAANAP